jgi:hypothetical protein
MKFDDLFDSIPIAEHSTRSSAMGAPGTLKAKISRLYGGSVTCAKTEKLKNRRGATAHDKAQANWFQNMNCGGASRLDELFTEPALQAEWRSYRMGSGQFWETELRFDDHRVVIEIVEMNPREVQDQFNYVGVDITVPAGVKAYDIIFRVNSETHVTGELGSRSASLLSQVVRVIRGFLERHKWHVITFTGKESSRHKLYDAMSRKISQEYGAQVQSRHNDFVIYKPDQLQEDAGGVGLVVPGVNMPAGMHRDEIRRQAKKWGFKVSAKGVPPVARTDGKLTESRSRACIVVDVQPAYSGIYDGNENPVFEEIIHFVNNQTGPVLMFVNAEDQGLTTDTVSDVKAYWEDSGFDPQNWSRVTVVDKGYGYLRSWLDQNIPARAIIKTIRKLYAERLTDSRQLFGGEDSDSYEQGFKQLLGPDYDPLVLDDPISVNWISVAQLKRFEGAYVMGGGRNECLREVELIMNAFNIHFKRIDSLVYG